MQLLMVEEKTTNCTVRQQWESCHCMSMFSTHEDKEGKAYIEAISVITKV